MSKHSLNPLLFCRDFVESPFAQKGPIMTALQVELETGSWVGWYNQTRLYSYCDYVLPTTFEANWQVSRTTIEKLAESVA